MRKKLYWRRERKPKILHRTTIQSQSPSSASSSTCSSDTDVELNVTIKKKTKGRQKSKTDDKKDDRALRDIQPVEVDGSVRFSSVGGLEEHKKCLREMVLFPLMYPDLFSKFNTWPSKGVLFHGPPGTGKTLLARALVNEYQVVGGKKVAFFRMNGADCLKKWVGESERHLKLLFQQANKMKPSIIFFDGIDALAPAQQDKVHASVVSTLLAEMDGLCDRGEVIIIGATNRLDVVDPVLRRADRFDRELHFPLPRVAARRGILDIYTRHWSPRPAADTLDYLAQVTSGFGGSDLKALCSEAVSKASRRAYPQVEVTREDLLQAMHSLVTAGARTSSLPPAKRLPTYAAPLLEAQVQAAAEIMMHVFPTAKKIGEAPLSPSVLLITGECSGTHIAPALLDQLDNCTVQELSMSTLHSVHAVTQEQALITLFSECRRADRGCVLFVRDCRSVWGMLGAAGAALFTQLWRTRAAGDFTLLLATAPVCHRELPQELQDLFPIYKDCVYNVREPSVSEVIAFLKPIITESPLEPPVIENHKPPPPLPRDAAKVQINKTELDNLLYKNVKSLRLIGLQALLSLHSQLSSVLRRYSDRSDRSKLPHDYQAVVGLYVQISRK